MDLQKSANATLEKRKKNHTPFQKDSNLREPLRRCKKLFELCMGVCWRVRGRRREKRAKKKKRRLDLSWVGRNPSPPCLSIKSSRLYSLHVLMEG